MKYCFEVVISTARAGPTPASADARHQQTQDRGESLHFRYLSLAQEIINI